jgi:hypothetical protein
MAGAGTKLAPWFTSDERLICLDSAAAHAERVELAFGHRLAKPHTDKSGGLERAAKRPVKLIVGYALLGRAHEKGPLEPMMEP